jgi:hypothetical protein
VKPLLLVLCLSHAALQAQEAASGFELGGSFSSTASMPTQDVHPVTAEARSLLYPTLKLNSHWSASATVQTRVHLSQIDAGSVNFAPGERTRTDVLQAYVTYARIWHNGSFAVRAGKLSSAFGSFLLRYDDARNPLIGTPLAYGYYAPVSPAGVTGAEIDLTLGKLDLRAQAANSSPANPRSLTDSDQYRNWAGGIGYAIRQGFRVGVSGYRGPYLDRHYLYYFPGEAKPHDLPASGWGTDVQWGHGPWNIDGEWQKFQMNYRAIPNFREHTGYAEARRVLHPRCYIAARLGYVRANAFPGSQVYEAAAGFRPGARQILKLGYQVQQIAGGRTTGAIALQFVTTVKALAFARD